MRARGSCDGPAHFARAVTHPSRALESGEYSRVNLLRATSLMHPDRLPASLKEIDKLYKALKARNAETAEAASRLHVANAEKAAMRMLEAE
jgi:DNA-binding FadR family transcriptional regulator